MAGPDSIWTFDAGVDGQPVNETGLTTGGTAGVYDNNAIWAGNMGVTMGPAYSVVTAAVTAPMTGSVYLRRGSETPNSKVAIIGFGPISVFYRKADGAGWNFASATNSTGLLGTDVGKSYANDKYRIDWQLTDDGTNLTMAVRIFANSNIDGTIADWTLSASVPSAAVTEMNVGTYASSSIHIDTLRLWNNTDAWPGPYEIPSNPPSGSAYITSGTPSLESFKTNPDFQITVPSGVTTTDTVLIFVAGSVSTPTSIVTSSSNGSFSELLPIRTDNNMFLAMVKGTGVKTGDTISVDVINNSLSMMSHHYFSRDVAFVGDVISVTSDTTQLTAPAVTLQPGQQAFVFETDRTQTLPSVTALTNSINATVTQLADSRQTGTSSSWTSTFVAQVEPSSTDSGTTTLTLSEPTHNSAIFHVVISAEQTPVNEAATFIAATSGTMVGSPLTGTVPAGVSKDHFGVLLFTNFTQSTVLNPTSSAWNELSSSYSPYVLQTATMVIMQTQGNLKAGDTFSVSFGSTGASGAWVAAWYDSAGIDAVGTGFDRSNNSSDITTFPSITTTEAPQTVLLLGGEKSTRGAMPGGTITSIISTSTGVTVDSFLDADIDSGTTSSLIARFNQDAAGATPEQSVTYSNASTRGYGLQLSLLGPSGTSSQDGLNVTVWTGTQEVAATVSVWTGTQEVSLGSVEVFGENGTGSYTDLKNATASSPIYIAHRGGSQDWPEMTKYAYDQAVLQYHIPALEISVLRSSDGVFVCSHDQSTLRVTGVDYDIPTTDWATLSALEVNPPASAPSQPAQPLTRLEDVLDAYASDHLIFIEDKSYVNNVALLDMMDSYPDSTNHFIWKLFGNTGNSPIDNGKNRGYKTWGYFFSGENMTHYDTNGLRFDYVGIDMNCSEAEFSQAAAINKPMIGHIVSTTSNRDKLLQHGCIGIMTSRLSTVIPNNYYQ